MHDGLPQRPQARARLLIAQGRVVLAEQVEQHVLGKDFKDRPQARAYEALQYLRAMRLGSTTRGTMNACRKQAKPARAARA